MKVFKLHALGNDFVLIPPNECGEVLSVSAFARAVCHRRTGLGADGVIQLTSTSDELSMSIRNADGGASEACGNAVRCVGAWAVSVGLLDGEDAVLKIQTAAGERSVAVSSAEDGRYASNLGKPSVMAPGRWNEPLWLQLEGHRIHAWPISMGNPHLVIPVDDVASANLQLLASQVRAEKLWADGINVSVISREEKGVLRQRIDERGVGETEACGTGAAAAVVAAYQEGWGCRKTVVHQPGGRLDVAWHEGAESVTVEGEAIVVGAVELSADWIQKGAVAHG